MTKRDKMMAELVSAGYTSGTFADRERARLIAKVGESGTGFTMADLYRLANEKNRLF